VAVDDLPLAVLAAVDVGDPQRVRLVRDAVAGVCGVFEADRVRQVPADAGGDKVEALRGAVGEPGREPVEGPG